MKKLESTLMVAWLGLSVMLATSWAVAAVAKIEAAAMSSQRQAIRFRILSIPVIVDLQASKRAWCPAAAENTPASIRFRDTQETCRRAFSGRFVKPRAQYARMRALG